MISCADHRCLCCTYSAAAGGREDITCRATISLGGVLTGNSERRGAAAESSRNSGRRAGHSSAGGPFVGGPTSGYFFVVQNLAGAYGTIAFHRFQIRPGSQVLNGAASEELRDYIHRPVHSHERVSF